MKTRENSQPLPQQQSPAPSQPTLPQSSDGRRKLFVNPFQNSLPNNSALKIFSTLQTIPRFQPQWSQEQIVSLGKKLSFVNDIRNYPVLVNFSGLQPLLSQQHTHASSQMSLSQVQTSSDRRKKSFFKDIKDYPALGIYSLIETLVTIGNVTLGSYLPELVLNRMQAGMPVSEVFTKAFFTTANYTFVRRALWSSAGANSVKVGVLSQREKFIDEELINPKKNSKDGKNEGIKDFISYVTAFRYVPIFALFEAGPTHPGSLLRLLADFGKEHPVLKKADGSYDYKKCWDFFKTGLPYRYTATLFNLGIFCTTTAVILPIIENSFPQKDHGIGPKIMATSIAAFFSATGGNGLYFIYKFEVKHLDTKTLQGPSAIEAFLKCFKTFGTGVFTKGLGVSVGVMNVTYFAIIGTGAIFKYGWDNYFQYKFPPPPDYPVANTPIVNAASSKEALQIKKVDEYIKASLVLNVFDPRMFGLATRSIPKKENQPTQTASKATEEDVEVQENIPHRPRR